MNADYISDYDDRQYMHSSDFELYYYQDLKPVKRTGLHMHSYYEFYFFVEGHVEITVGQQQYPLSYGDIVIIPPNVSHGAFIKDYNVPYKRFDLWISIPSYNRLMSLSRDFGYAVDTAIANDSYVIHTDRITFKGIENMLFTILKENRADRFGRSICLALDIAQLILTISRTSHEQGEKQKLNKDDLYSSICKYIDQNIGEDLSLDNIAEHFSLSKSYISHIFKDNAEVPLHRYITKERLKLCRDAIAAGEPISYVYGTYGFDDYSSFYRAFKKEFGISPKEL
ncbi:MAG: helix-turn-helix transcriptional regulator [Lachnospiraceae bacterium]|nr:helix-turn-helix transcriptional regulator [Lachnospiraceae bacterium]